MTLQHGIIGDQGFETDVPRTQPLPDQDLNVEKNMAKFAKSKEFAKLKDHLEQRINFYQTQLPDGRVLTEVNTSERANQWVIANAIIGEFKAVIAAYELAQETVSKALKEAQGRL